VPPDFSKDEVLIEQLGTCSGPPLRLAVASLAIIRFGPGPGNAGCRIYVALLVGTLAVALFHVPVETNRSKFGTIPAGLPMPHCLRSLLNRFVILPAGNDDCSARGD